MSLAYTDESLMGQVGKVIVPVPVDGFGEIVIEIGEWYDFEKSSRV